MANTKIGDMVEELRKEGMSTEQILASIRRSSATPSIAPVTTPELTDAQLADLMATAENDSARPVIDQSKASERLLRGSDDTPVNFNDIEIPEEDWYLTEETVRFKEVKITGNMVRLQIPSEEWSERVNLLMVSYLDSSQIGRLERGDMTVYNDSSVGKNFSRMISKDKDFVDDFLVETYPDLATKFSRMRPSIKLAFFVEALRALD